MKNYPSIKINDNHLIGIMLIAYGAYYIFVLHEHIIKYGIDWIVSGWFGLSGFSHSIHKPIGILMVISGLLLIFRKIRIFSDNKFSFSKASQ